MVLLVDNYDSFTYNLVQLIGETTSDIQVVRNDKITLTEIKERNPSHIVLSPGAGKPEDTKVCIDVVRELSDTYPILGVCLGHQTICEVMGMTVTYAKQLMHGKTSQITLNSPENSQSIFASLPPTITVARYHSLAAVADTLPVCLDITATTEDGEIMAVQKKGKPVYGLQFHPESILTPQGNVMMQNFLKEKGDRP